MRPDPPPARAGQLVDARAADVGEVRADRPVAGLDPPGGAGGVVVERERTARRDPPNPDRACRKPTDDLLAAATGSPRWSGDVVPPASPAPPFSGRSDREHQLGQGGVVRGAARRTARRRPPTRGAGRTRGGTRRPRGRRPRAASRCPPAPGGRGDPHAVGRPPRRAARRRTPAARTCSPRRTPSPGRAVSPAPELSSTTRPRAARSAGSSSRVSSATATTLTSNWRRQIAGRGVGDGAEQRRCPAECTSTSSRSMPPAASATAASSVSSTGQGRDREARRRAPGGRGVAAAEQ